VKEQKINPAMLKNRAIILAAGSSSRMGTQKMLLPFGESTILETVIENILSSSVDSILVVLGANHDEIHEVIKPWPVEVCFNKNHQSGMLSSVICGMNALPDDTGTVLVYLGDQPGISPRVTDTLLEAFHESICEIVIPVTNQRRGHPLLVDFKYKSEIEKLDPEKGLRALMLQFPEDVLEAEIEAPGILLDIDTPEEYSIAKKMM
jgi:molybdenum cofactor cytidylyltransferase